MVILRTLAIIAFIVGGIWIWFGIWNYRWSGDSEKAWRNIGGGVIVLVITVLVYMVAANLLSPPVDIRIGR